MTKDEIEYWSELPSWDLDELANISLNLDPNRGVVNKELDRDNPPAEIEKLLARKVKAKDIIKRAVYCGDLNALRLSDIDKYLNKDSSASDSIKNQIRVLTFSGKNLIFKPEDAIRWILSKKILFPDFPTQFYKQKKPTQDEDEITFVLSQNKYWTNFNKKLHSAMQRYPEWRKKQPNVLIIENVLNWVEESTDITTRESHVIKNVLAETYKIKR